MPKYEVTTSPGHQFPVGFEFETDNLHPSMVQHVRMIGRKTAEPEPEKEPEPPKKDPVKKEPVKKDPPPKDDDDDNT